MNGFDGAEIIGCRIEIPSKKQVLDDFYCLNGANETIDSKLCELSYMGCMKIKQMPLLKNPLEKQAYLRKLEDDYFLIVLNN